MRRASILVLILTFLALVAGTLAVPARSAGMVWTVTSVVTTPAESAPTIDPDWVPDDEAEGWGDPAPVDPPVSTSPSITTKPLVLGNAQGTLALGLGQPDLHWQPLWKLFWPEPGEGEQQVTLSGVSPLATSFSQDWTVDREAWALQLGLILALGGLAFLALRVIAARRESNRDLDALAAR